MEDAVEQDVKLHRSSADLIAEFQCSLPRLLWKSPTGSEGTSRELSVRKRVPERRVFQLTKLLEPFQEWPQLLDPQLAAFMRSLSSAFLHYLTHHAAQYSRHPRSDPSSSAIPLPRAICRLIYTLCKVRGYKVICQLLNNEPKYLEPVLDAFWAWNWPQTSSEDGDAPMETRMEWEERYVMLLWLSHLLLAPFDLASISIPRNFEHLPQPLSDADQFPALPMIATRLLYLASARLSSASKEREAAGILLARLTLRTDMLELGLHTSFVHSTLSSLRTSAARSSSTSIYSVIGNLSFLSGLIKSAADSVMRTLHQPIFELAQLITAANDSEYAELRSSAVARKLVIKIQRELAISAYRMDLADNTEVLGKVIDHLLISIGDKDTTVRLAASKALSAVAVQVGPESAGDIAQSLLEGLGTNFWWPATTNNRRTVTKASGAVIVFEGYPMALDYASVDALRWHGLILALSHLLFRRSIPLSLIAESIKFLIVALDFHQLSSLGNAVGTNVRDGACFGFWALARKYNTREIIENGPGYWINKSDPVDQQHTLQTLANKLMVAACLDPSGNIRRGASAALQEMVGRHPDKITAGISLVQIVDYHAVALRSHAITEVAKQASSLDDIYYRNIEDELMNWKGIEAVDAPSRRLAAAGLADISINRLPDCPLSTMLRIQFVLQRTGPNLYKERHGLLMALANLMEAIQSLRHVMENLHGSSTEETREEYSKEQELVGKILLLIEGAQLYLPDEFWISPFIEYEGSSTDPLLDEEPKRPEYVYEAACKLFIVLAKMSSSQMQPELSSPISTDVLDRYFELFQEIIFRPEDSLFDIGPEAMRHFFLLVKDPTFRRSRLKRLLCLQSDIVHASERRNWIKTLAFAFHSFLESPVLQMRVLRTLIDSLQPEHPIEVRCASLEGLLDIFAGEGGLPLSKMSEKLIESLLICLDDYTTDQRGDIGSLIRIKAIDTVSVALENHLIQNSLQRQLMVAKICGLAVEKLDKVRYQAAAKLQVNWNVFGFFQWPRIDIQDISQTTTSKYFASILALCTLDEISVSVLSNFVTAAAGGAVSLQYVSRAALVAHTEKLSLPDLAIFCTHFVDILRDNFSNDRVLLPAMEVIAFMLDVGILQRLIEGLFDWRRLFNSIRQAHYKSGNLRKLESAISVYHGLITIPELKYDASQKLCSMLLHGMIKIRNLAADALFLATDDEDLLPVNWDKSPKELKPIVEKLQSKLKASAADAVDMATAREES